MRTPIFVSKFGSVVIEACFYVFDARFRAGMELPYSTAIRLVAYDDAGERLRGDVLLVTNRAATICQRDFTACVFVITVVIRRRSRARVKNCGVAAFGIRAPATNVVNGSVTR